MELHDKLLEISRLFRIDYEYLGYETIQMGNVNRTYKVNFRLADGTPKSFLVQNVNTYAFRNPVALMDNIDHTFVTPVFNGSASVRDAAGQLIENTTKSVRRGENVSGYYFSGLYADVISLYRLDQVASSTKAEDLGALPAGSVALLCTLAGCWLCIGVYAAAQKIKDKKTEKLRSND